MKPAKIICSLWCVYPKGRGVVDDVGHLKRAFCLFLNINIMITKIKNDEGKECFAIVMNEHASYEDITAMQAVIINILQAATHSDLFQAFADEVYDLLNLLLETLPNDTQSLTYQMAVFPKNNN